MRRAVGAVAVLALIQIGGVCSPKVEPPPFPRTEVRADCDDYEPLRQPFFGDTHVHTYLSLDADTRGTRVTPTQAYDFAKGMPVMVQPLDAMGNPTKQLQIDRPLDFTMVADHAEFFGELLTCRSNVLPGWDAPNCDPYRTDPNVFFITLSALLAAPQDQVVRDAGICGADGQRCVDRAVTLWGQIQDAAEAHYDRTAACGFTTFVGYEWTAAPVVANLHRNVVFRNSEVPAVPASYLDVPYVEELWDSLDSECRQSPALPGCDALIIPHNTNLGYGRAFETVDKDGNPFDAARAQRQADFEPLLELTQHKGASECFADAWSGDELCDFENVPWNNISGLPFFGDPLPQDYVRAGLAEGLVQEQTVGANPFRYGLIGSTDNHQGTPGKVRENGERIDPSGGPGNDWTVERQGLSIEPYYNAGGLAVVWAEENSRDSIFEAMRRREAYATSGTRPIVRFFGGWKYPAGLCGQTDPVLKADEMGVPMGAELAPRLGNDWTPKFYASALKDAGGNATDLQRIQVVKGWVDGAGQTHEQVYEAAGDPNNGASVDTATCQTQGAGFAELCTVWEDPDFDPAERAFYYARVVENPVCRWSQHQCNAAGVDCAVPATITAGFEPCCDGTIPATIQERAWTSPIWYRPESGL